MSGGIDSSVSSALCVQGARHRNACTASCCPSAIPRASAPRAASSSPSTSASATKCSTSRRRSRRIGCYRRRDEAIRRVFPEYGDGWKNKIVIKGGLEGRINHFKLVVQTPAGETQDRAPAAAGIPADRRRDQPQAAHPQDGGVLPRRPPELRRDRHAEPPRVRPGLLREERRRQRRRQADRAPLQDAGVRAGAAHEAARRRSAPRCRPPTPTAWRRARTSSISRCRTRRWTSRCGRSTTATPPPSWRAALEAHRGAGAARVQRHRGQAQAPRATCT